MFCGVSRDSSRPGPVDDDLAELAHFGLDAETHDCLPARQGCSRDCAAARGSAGDGRFGGAVSDLAGTGCSRRGAFTNA